jgi:SprT-like protein
MDKENILEELNNKAHFFTMQLWNKELNIPVVINKRLKSTLGQYCPNKTIEISCRILKDVTLTIDTLLHELCHWYCHISNKQWDDRTEDFEEELERIGASSTESTEIINGEYKYIYKYGSYKCNICGKEFKTKDYLEDRQLGEAGRKFKTFECCSEKMKVLGEAYIPEVFILNDKILSLLEKYEFYKKKTA